MDKFVVSRVLIITPISFLLIDEYGVLGLVLGVISLSFGLLFLEPEGSE